jgi:hypothetical protein
MKSGEWKFFVLWNLVTSAAAAAAAAIYQPSKKQRTEKLCYRHFRT